MNTLLDAMDVNTSNECSIDHCFICSVNPLIDLQEYGNRIEQFFQCDPLVYDLALNYFNRLVDLRIKMCSTVSHKVLFTICNLARKYIDEFPYQTQNTYCAIAGFSIQELTVMEIWMLKYLNNNLNYVFMV